MKWWWPWRVRLDVTDEQILAAFDPWVLACAVGAENGSTGSSLRFESWLRISRDNWLREVQERLKGVSRARIETVLRLFVHENAHKNYAVLLHEIEEARGLPQSIVIGPGETVEVRMEFEFRPDGKSNGN